MKNTILTLITSCALALSMTACGGSSDNNNTNTVIILILATITLVQILTLLITKFFAIGYSYEEGKKHNGLL